MAARDPQELREMLEGMLQPWHDAVGDPAAAQEEVLRPCWRSTPRPTMAANTARARSTPSPTTAAPSPSRPTRTTSR